MHSPGNLETRCYYGGPLARMGCELLFRTDLT